MRTTRWLVPLVLLWLARWALAAGVGSPPSRPAGDVTFLATSDVHYDAFENEDRNERVRDTLKHMNDIGSVPWPERLGGDAIRPPRGVVALGDVLDDGDRLLEGKSQGPEQFKHFLADFGLDGTDGLLKFPVFEGWGNHDGPPAGRERHGFSFQAELRKRNAQRKARGWLAGLSDNGLHYSWDWDDVHLVQLNIYPADRQHADIKYSAVHHDPQNSLTFLKADLAACVGDSRRPVVLLSHCGFDTNWWHPEDWQALYDAVKPYNVVLYLYGHTGTGLRDWKPQGEATPLTCINTGQTENGFFVVHLAHDRLRAAYRVKVWRATEKPPAGPPSRTWAGEWEWKHLLDRGLAAPSRQGAP